jgi:hypothetical protein
VAEGEGLATDKDSLFNRQLPDEKPNPPVILNEVNDQFP